MKVTKKLLSVLLAVIMIMSSMSVCFGINVFAADDTNAVKAFVAAMKCDAMKSFSTVYSESTNNKTGASKEVTNTFTYTAPSYNYYEQVVNVVAKLDAAIKGLDEYKNGSTHNNGGNCQDGWGNGTATDKCTDLGWIERHLKLAIGDAELATLNGTYNFANLCNAIFNMDDCEWRNADNDLDGDDTTSTSNVEARVHNVLVVTINDVSGKVLSYNSVNDIPDSLGNKYEYKLSMCRQNYQTGSWIKTNHYHHALNTKNSDAANPAPSQTGTTSTATIKSNINTCLTALAAYSKYTAADEVTDFLTDSTTAETLAADKKAMLAAKKALTDTSNGTALYNKFVKPTYDVENGETMIDNAISFLNAAAVVEKFNEYLAVDYSDYTTDQLLELKNGLEATYDTFKALEEATQQMIIDEYDLDTAAVEAKITAVDHAWQVSQVTDFKATVDSHIAAYENWTLDDVDEGRVTTAELTTALAVLNSDLAELGNYTYEYVLEACGRQYVTALEALRNNIQYLAKASGYNDSFLAEFDYFEEYIEEITTTDYEDLRASLESYDSRYSQLKTLISKMETEIGKENAAILFDAYDVRMTTHVNNAYIALNARVEAQINVAYDLYTAYEEVYGDTVHMASLKSYKILRESIGLIDTASYEYLLRTVHFGVSAETVAKYDALQAILRSYKEFEDSKGFATYKTSEIDDIVREETADDIAREGDYTVTDELVLNVINTLEAALSDPQIKALLGNFINKDKETGEPTGQPFDIAGLVSGLIEDKVYTNELINTVIQFLYPAVANIFTEVWMGINPKIDDPAMDVMGQKLHVEADLYLKTVEEATAGLNLPIFPKELATAINNNYSQFSAVANVLDDATSKAYIAKDTDGNWDPSTRVSPWDDAALYTEKLDAEGNAVVDENGNPTMVLNLDWGINDLTGTARRERFLQAVQAALYGLEPILLALLANKEMNLFNPLIGTGSGTLYDYWIGTVVKYLLDNVNINKLPLDIHTIDLMLHATANDGYNNVIAPLLEMLGLVAPDGSTFTSSRAVIEKGLIEPIEALIAKLASDPLETILDILPNLAYAVEADLLLGKLDYLSINIDYSAGATIDADLNNAEFNTWIDLSKYMSALSKTVSDMVNLPVEKGIIKNVRCDGVMTDNLPVEISGIVNIGELLGGIDLTSFAGIWEMLAGSVELLAGVEAPDAAYIASLGTLGTIDTKRSLSQYTMPVKNGKNQAYHITADKEDILIYLVRWALESGILGGIVAEPDETVAAIFENLATNPDGAIAAIVELLNQIEYDTLENYVWYNGYIDNVEVGTVSGNPAYKIYMNPGNDWTKEKAEFLYNNLTSIIDAVLPMAGADFTLTGVLADTLGGLFTNETIQSVIGIFKGFELDPAIADLLSAKLGVNLGAYAEMEYTAFEDGDVDGFVAALTEVVAPLAPVVDFILEGADLEINLGNETVTLIGSDGYNSAILPLLEALGCKAKALGENDDALALTLDALKGLIKSVLADPVKAVFDILPGALYFLAGNNLATAVRNLLQPVYVILDTVRPVYDLDLEALINGLKLTDAKTGEESTLAQKLGFEIDLDVLNLNTVLDIAGQFIDLGTLFDDLKVMIYDICKAVGTEYKSASDFQKTWKKGAYSENFDQADLLTVVLSFVLEWATVEDNAKALDEMLGTDGLIASLNSVFADVKIEYGTPNWMYWFETEEKFNEYLAGGENLPNTLEALTYPNDWSEEAAAYIADNLASLADMVVGLIEIDGTKYASVAELIDAKLDVFSAETINSIVALIADLLKDIDDNLLSVGCLLDVDVVGLKNYTCTAEVNDVKSFAKELANILTTYAGGLVNWLFFGDDFRFAVKSDGTDTIVINGGLGYEKGLALVLEALGCDLPENATVESVLLALASRVEEILASPVNEVVDLLPNLVYFLNADGASVAVDNLLKPVYALLDKLAVFGIELDLAGLLGFDLKYLSLEDILALVKEKTGLDLSEAEEMLVNLCFGKIEKAKYTYKMVADRKDVITVVLTTALLLVQDEDFAAKLEEMMGTDMISAIKTVFESAPVTYKTPDWYALDENDIDYDNATVGVIKHAITYPNNWTEESAKYLADNLTAIGDMVAGIIDGNYASLGALLGDKVNIYTPDTLKAIQKLLGDLIGGLDADLQKLVNVGLGAADALLGADVKGLLDYDVSGVKDKETFVAALTGMLMEVEGLIDWLLLGEDYRFFVDNSKDIITINGGHGYAEGLGLVLEALGVENLPDVYAMEEIDTKAVVSGVLTATFDRVDAILANPVEEVFNLLPNVLYFINANGLTVAIENLIGAVNALLIKLEGFGIELDIASLVNFSEILGVETELALDNINMADVIALVAELTGLNLDKAADVLVGFALGRVAAYESVSSADITAKMYYHDDFAKYDMITALATVAINTLTDDANAAKVKEMLGEEVYQVILNLINMGEVEVQDFDWQFTERADTDYVFSAAESSELLGEGAYGMIYTEEMAQYIADNFGDFVNNIVYLLGLDVDGSGETEKNLKELINSFLGGSVYNSDIVITIRDALAGVLANLTDLQVNGKVVGGLIADVLKTTGVADIAAVAEVKVEKFENDREAFVVALCDVLEPLYGILKFVLADEDITFFVNMEKKDAITLKGAEGYAYGILPLLETLGCKNLIAPEAYYAAVEADGSVLLTSILNPLFDRVDEILADDPAQAILDMLPNLIYFINSNGVDTVVKNTLNAVYAIFEAIAPIAKLDLYELIGVDLAEIDFEWLVNKLFEVLKNAGYEFTINDINYIAELTVGKLESYTSLNGKTAYRMVYAEGESGDKKELVTIVANLIITFIANETNKEVVLRLLREKLGMSEEVEPYVDALLELVTECVTDTKLGTETALSSIYYVFYGVDAGVGGVAGGVKDLNKLWKDSFDNLKKENSAAGELIEEVLGWDIFEDIIDVEEGIAPNGLIKFFAKIIEWFKSIVNWFKNLFNRAEPAII